MLDASRIPPPAARPPVARARGGAGHQVRDALGVQRRRHQPPRLLQHERAQRRRDDRPQAGEDDEMSLAANAALH